MTTSTSIQATPESATLSPVTQSGWYERIDGTVGEYVWRDGFVRLSRVVATWADVPERDYAAEERASRAVEVASLSAQYVVRLVHATPSPVASLDNVSNTVSVHASQVEAIAAAEAAPASANLWTWVVEHQWDGRVAHDRVVWSERGGDVGLTFLRGQVAS